MGAFLKMEVYYRKDKKGKEVDFVVEKGIEWENTYE